MHRQIQEQIVGRDVHAQDGRSIRHRSRYVLRLSRLWGFSSKTVVVWEVFPHKTIANQDHTELLVLVQATSQVPKSAFTIPIIGDWISGEYSPHSTYQSVSMTSWHWILIRSPTNLWSHKAIEKYKKSPFTATVRTHMDILDAID